MSVSSSILQDGQVVSDGLTAKKINSLLNNSKTRLEGLQLLSLFSAECPDKEFVQFCCSWMQNCCKIDGSMKNRDFAVRLLDNLFKISSNYEELKKSVSFFITTRYFDFFFKYFLNSQAGWSCTKTCLSLYRRASGPFEEELRKHLKNEMKKKVRMSPTLAACYALIPCIGGGGNEGLIYKKNWRAQFGRFLSDCHSVLNDLYADVEDFQETRAFEHLEAERDIELLVTQLYNRSAVLNSMLLNKYPAPKNIPSDEIFELICRGLAINPKALTSRQTTAVMSLQKVLPEIHVIFFSLLKAAIVTCRSQLLPYSHLICKLIKQSLEWTASECSSGCEKPFGSLRIAIYETLCNWLAVARNGSCVETVSGVMVSNAVSDIESKKGVVCLKEAKAQNKSDCKEPTRRIDQIVNSNLCYAALKALQFLLKFVGVSLKPEEQKLLQELVVKLVVDVQKSSTFNFVVPFSVLRCRLGLYSLLVDLVHQPCPKWPPPTNYALRLLSKGINDISPEVSAFCSSAVNLLTIIVHPQYDNGGFRPDEMPEYTSRAEVELQWMQELDEANEKEETETPEEEILEMDETCEKNVISDEESHVSSNEDSRNTITFLKESSEPKTFTKEATLEKSPPTPTDEPSPKKPKLNDEEPGKKESVSPKEENLSVKISSPLKERAEDPKLTSPEAISEDSHPKARYFLRSKRKGSSEEPEEPAKKTTSPESTKSKGSGKATPILTGKKRPRARAPLKIEINDETEKNIHEDNEEDDLKALFDDSFVD